MPESRVCRWWLSFCWSSGLGLISWAEDTTVGARMSTTSWRAAAGCSLLGNLAGYHSKSFVVHRRVGGGMCEMWLEQQSFSRSDNCLECSL